MNDESLMPWGRYKGYNMINVPASYLIWLYENNKCDDQVREYIEDNLSFLREEVRHENR
jgi:uncharacterized protein (DUF3820 family)